jgi:hypothetical protein
LEFLAKQNEKSNPEVAAILYTVATSLYTNQEDILFREVQKIGTGVILPEANLLAEASENVNNLLSELNMN